ncbi:UNVERIFIED_CONTAM: hypothetical protein FKN15_061039 [Acipenser sinensis]
MQPPKSYSVGGQSSSRAAYSQARMRPVRLRSVPWCFAISPSVTMPTFHPCMSCRGMLPLQDKHLLCVWCLGMQHTSYALGEETFCTICAASQPWTLRRRLTEFTGAASSASSIEPSAALGALASPSSICP